MSVLHEDIAWVTGPHVLQTEYNLGVMLSLHFGDILPEINTWSSVQRLQLSDKLTNIITFGHGTVHIPQGPETEPQYIESGLQ